MPGPELTLGTGNAACLQMWCASCQKQFDSVLRTCSNSSSKQRALACSCGAAAVRQPVPGGLRRLGAAHIAACGALGRLVSIGIGRRIGGRSCRGRLLGRACAGGSEGFCQGGCTGQGHEWAQAVGDQLWIAYLCLWREQRQ